MDVRREKGKEREREREEGTVGCSREEEYYRGRKLDPVRTQCICFFIQGQNINVDIDL